MAGFVVGRIPPDVFGPLLFSFRPFLSSRHCQFRPAAPLSVPCRVFSPCYTAEWSRRADWV